MSSPSHTSVVYIGIIPFKDLITGTKSSLKTLTFKIEPSHALKHLSLYKSQQVLDKTTLDTLNPRALRIIVPILPGSQTPSKRSILSPKFPSKTGLLTIPT